ncbi:putative NifU-like scaffold protein [Plasmodium gaboni]|uniref:NifU-like scaffold protein, putative n=1 Tax=Plasmodium gaboni TaxID=647221 RepID=A0A151LLT3_9APIC|nr:putative NifU-like scaffold protein [Plasmodium gaboni]XP_028538217.1 NifU-like scaffold protein, putative [Plasmodium sp. gorilla clade G2]SOV22584.1 NifU-like scaffold protein, putative [Plasmodium sp. DRC-Itaito]KYO00195.1 putative NifU-like scaffold protein [Plasmodium gaboni]SOV14185.1 NifU-like scaffold protein, putative [Plasmodium gaboni]SOV14309.1 NifU-like scaffold protein, putative [Plasmodium sp. gorilla clade G2]
MKCIFLNVLFIWYFFFVYVKNISILKYDKPKVLFIQNNFEPLNNNILRVPLNILRKRTNVVKNKKNIVPFQIFLSSENDEGLYYELNPENVEKVLNLIRPKLQIDNGDVELVDIKNNDLYIRLLGNCVTCSSNSITVSHVIKKTLKMYIRNEQNQEPNVIITNFDEINEQNIQNCLSQLKPYLDFLKVEVIIKELVNNKENINNYVCLKFLNIENSSEDINIPHNVKNEITERLKQKFPTLTVNFEN